MMSCATSMIFCEADDMKRRARHFEDLTGQKFGRLEVISVNHLSIDRRYRVYWMCLCQCGKTTVAPAHKLKAGTRVSCGCARTTDKARAASIKSRMERAAARRAVPPLDKFLYKHAP